MNKVEILQKSRLFDKLLPDELETLGELTQQREYNAGETIFEEGDVGDALYVIVDGEVDVLRANARGEHKQVATLKAPDFFGEMSLIDKEYRSATIRAKNSASLLSLSNENLHSFAKVYRDGFTWVAVNIARVLSERLRETNRRLAEKE